MSGDRIIKVGSRKSELALIQTRHVIKLLQELNPDRQFEIVTMDTLGDNVLDIPLPKIGEKSLFTKELEIALEKGHVDFVVHSLKDLPTTLPEGMSIGAVLSREDPRDALVLHADCTGHTLDTLPEGTVLGTSSLRRAAQLARKYPHLNVENIRGNINTRLRKLDELGTFKGIILAAAGLHRIGWHDRISRLLESEEVMYAVGQGALAVECRTQDTLTIELLRPIYDLQTALRILVERSFLKTLGGGCSAPVAITTNLSHVKTTKHKITVTGAVWSLDGKTEIKDSDECVVDLCAPNNNNKCASCPYKDVDKESVEGTNKSSCSRSYCSRTDIECLKRCSFRRKSDAVNGNEKNGQEDPPIKKQKTTHEVVENDIEIANPKSPLLLTEDPHLDLPIGYDFMGKCPYLEATDVNTTMDKLGCDKPDIKKCPFYRSQLEKHKNGTASSSKANNQVKDGVKDSYCGLVPHTGIKNSAMDSARDLGKILAEKLIKLGAADVISSAQWTIHNS